MNYSCNGSLHIIDLVKFAKTECEYQSHTEDSNGYDTTAKCYTESLRKYEEKFLFIA